jgi:uncharacterized protein DUF4388
MSEAAESRTPLPDRLARLAARALSGRLVVSHAEGSSEIWIDAGRVVRARNPESDRRLAARLVVGGHALTSDITKARRGLKGRPLIEALIDRGAVRRDVLKTVENAEARYALAAALGADPADVTFERDAPEAPPPLLDVDPLDLLAETETFLAGLEAAERFAPAWCVPSLPNGLPGPDVALGPEEWAVLARIDGVAPITTIAEETGFPEAEVALAVFRLSALGLATVSGVEGAPADRDVESSLAYLDEIEIPDLEIDNDAPIARSLPAEEHGNADVPHYEAPPEFAQLASSVAEAAVAVAETPPPPPPEPAPEPQHGAAFPVPSPPEHPVDAPVKERIPSSRRPDPEVDTKSLLRELAWLARDPENNRR